mmetsp:Transcript_13385/g.21885  ORF Transcript_13385/g.21885 Transcript_13385/m.21885 type:complete len:1335 (-) Transcript_13385:313-4317(-)
MSLQSYVRDVAGLKGTKYGCGEGGCGACAMTLSRWVNGKEEFKSVNSCLAPLASAHGWAITTVEGLRTKALKNRTADTPEGDTFHPIQKRLAQMNGLQCGFCSPGMVMTMYQALKKNPSADMAYMESQLDGNICRCTGYRPILDTAKSFAKDSDTVDHICKKSYTKGCYDMEKWDQKFPEELKGFESKQSIAFSKNGITWVKPASSMDALAKAMAAYPDARLTVGKTSYGIYKPAFVSDSSEEKGLKRTHHWHLESKEYKTFIDISDIPEINGVKVVGDGIVVGAASKISHVMNALTANKSASVSFAPLVAHMKKVANVHVRDSGSIAGNIMLAKTKGFLSDLATILLGAGAIVKWAGKTDKKETMEEFLATPKLPVDMTLLESIFIPFHAGAGAVFKTYRAAIRPVNAHAIVNAAFKASCGSDGVVKGVTIAYGGLMSHEDAGSHAIRMGGVEKIMEGKKLTNSVYRKARKALREAVEQMVKKAGGLRASSRVALADSFFVRFCLGFSSKSDKTVASAAETIDAKRLRVSCAKQSFGFSEEHAPVSLPIPLLSGKLLSSGSAKFNSDTTPVGGTLFGAIAYARRARAVIKDVDFSVGLKQPGVRGHVAKAEVGDNTWSVTGEPYDLGDKLTCYYKPTTVLGKGEEVPYSGACVGLLIADSLEQARNAIRFVRVIYEEQADGKEAILSIAKAVESKEIIPSLPFLPTEFKNDAGDAKKVFADEEGKGVVLKGKSRVGRQKHFYMDPCFAYAVPDEERGIRVVVSSQWPQGANSNIAAAVKKPMSMINIVHGRMGGSFGGKNIGYGAQITAIAATRFNAPVYVHLDRNCDMQLVGGRPDCEASYKVAAGKEGKIKALSFEHMLASGASANLGWFTNMSVGSALTQAYHLPNREITARMCLTNEAPVNVMRGPGEIQASVHIETIIEHVAHALNLDPHQVRKTNMLPDDKKILKDCGFAELDKYTALKCWEELEASCDYKKRSEKVKAFNSTNKLKKKGICMVPMRYKVNIWKRSALVNLYTDGTVCVMHGATPMGQGIQVKVAQVVAHELGKLTGEPLSLNKIKFAQYQSRMLSSQVFTGGSTGTEGACEAARRACEALVKRMGAILAGLEEKAKSESKGGEDSTHDDRKPISFGQVCAAAEGANMMMQALGHWSDTKDNDKATYNCWGVGCSEVEIDVMTGEIVVDRVDLIIDCAKSLNPAIDIGQAEGGFMQGLGMMIQEEVLYDEGTGELISNGTWEYKPPLAINVPREWNLNLLQGNKVGRVLSSKASGEPPLVLASSVLMALRHAIRDARAEVGLKDFFALPAPATLTTRMTLLAPVVEKLEALDKPFSD